MGLYEIQSTCLASGPCIRCLVRTTIESPCRALCPLVMWPYFLILTVAHMKLRRGCCGLSATWIYDLGHPVDGLRGSLFWGPSYSKISDLRFRGATSMDSGTSSHLLSELRTQNLRTPTHYALKPTTELQSATRKATAVTIIPAAAGLSKP